MSREARRVPADWVHPTVKGHPIPMHQHFPYDAEEVAEGLRDGWLVDEPPNYGCPVMPDWPENERTHWQMYDTCTEGTPISPVMDSRESLADWLVDNGASYFGDMLADRDRWLYVIDGGYSGIVLTRKT